MSQSFFRPFGARACKTFYPRLAPWALFLRRFAAFCGPATHFLLASEIATQTRNGLMSRRNGRVTWLAPRG
jgi:hypothetical protein